MNPSNNGARGDRDARDERASIQDAERAAELRAAVWTLYDGLIQPRPTMADCWLFEGVLARYGGAVLNLDSGQGKTWIQLEIGICTVTGRALFDRFDNHRKGPAILLLEEDDRDNALDRGKQLVLGKQLTDAEREYLRNLHILNFSGLHLDTAAGLHDLRELCAEIKPAYLGLDPMAEFHSQPENDSMRMLSNLLRPIRNLAREFRFLSCFSHHTRKVYAGQDNDVKQSGRGTSAIKGWCDSAWYVKAVGDVLSVETKQRQGSADHPALATFSLRRIESREKGIQTWAVSAGLEEDLQVRHDAALVLDVVANAKEVLNRDLEKNFPKWNHKRLDTAVEYLIAGKNVTIVYEPRLSADGKNRKQKVIRFGSSEGTEDNRGFNRGQTRFNSTEEPRTTPIRGFGS